MPSPMTADAPLHADLVIAHGYVVTMDEHGRVIPDGAVAIAGRSIAGIGTSAEILARFQATRVIDAAAPSCIPASSSATPT